MTKSKKFGTFSGVFTPSLLTILGVIMYLRIGWVTGHAGWDGIIIIILLAHVISVSTGLSISSIATDKKVGAGGVYYVLSRSLGLPIGGAIGITLFLGVSLSIALYLVGFADIFNEFTQIGYVLNDEGVLVPAADMTNSYRLTGSIALLILTVIAFISTSVAIKSQYIILTFIVLSLISIFAGNVGNIPDHTGDIVSNEVVGWGTLFAIFFPAVTGFTTGVAMSGDLKDSKKSIPFGTMGSIIVGFLIYMVLALFLAFMIDREILISNQKVLFEYAAIGLLVYLGVWGATLSSALGGILGGPRILQAMSVDQLTPKVFAKGVGANNEPRNALILTVVIAECGVLIGSLDMIAEVVSMFYLAAYGFINLSFFLESWASSDFNPTFKVKKWIGLGGFVVTFIIMSQLNLLAMIASLVIILGIYFYLSRRQISLGTGDIWQSVWATVVKKGLKRMEGSKEHIRNWKPNIILFSTNANERSHMIEFAKVMSGQRGIITNFDLHENPDAKVLFPKSKEIVTDEELENFGIFGRRLEVQNIFKGIESIACTFGFSGIEPNTVLMNWPGQTKDPIWFTDMTEKLFDLDYNVLYLDYDERWGFRKKEQIDLWWRGVGNNAELMLSLAKFITSSPDWSRASIRILIVNDTNVDFNIVEKRIRAVVEQFRVKAEVRVVNNEIDGKPIYELMKIHSSEADLVFVGIPEIGENERDEFVQKTNELVSVIGTTLLVKASSHFDETDLKLEQISLKPIVRDKIQTTEIPLSSNAASIEVMANYDNSLEAFANQLVENGIQPIENYHHTIFAKVTNRMDTFLSRIDANQSKIELHSSLQLALSEIKSYYADAIQNQLPLVFEGFNSEWKNYLSRKEELVAYIDKSFVFKPILKAENDGSDETFGKKRKIRFREAIQHVWRVKGVQTDFLCIQEFGYQNLILLHQSKKSLHDVIWRMLANIDQHGISLVDVQACKQEIDMALNEVNESAIHLAANLRGNLRNAEREFVNELAELFLEKNYRQAIYQSFPPQPIRVIQGYRKDNLIFPNYWYRNLILFTYHLQADIYLVAFSAKIQGLSDKIIQQSEERDTKKIGSNLSTVRGQLKSLEDLISRKEEQKILGTAIRLSDELFFNPEFLVAKFLTGISEFNSAVPSEIELMTAKSVNGIKEGQGDNVKTEKIALKEITDYITRTYFTDPLNDRIQVYYDQLKKIGDNLVNVAALLQKGIDVYATSHDFNELSDIIVLCNTDLDRYQLEFEGVRLSFVNELIDRQQILRKELDIDHIIEHVERLRQYVKQQKKRSVLLDKFQSVNQNATKKVGYFLAYLAQKKQDRTALEYKAKYSDLVSEQGKFTQFMQAISPPEDLPFYYQQLFTGTHYSDSKTIENRRFELNRIELAINQIKSGRKGAIAIIGRASSGKTYLTTHVASHSLTGSIYKIVPPLKREWTIMDLNLAFQRATGISGDLEEIFSKISPQSTLVFEDLEQWWLKTEGGEILLNEIAKLINQFGGDHYFLLSANLHAYRLLCTSSVIQSAVIQTIILAPLTIRQIREAIWNRHLVGGVRIQFDEKKEFHFTLRKLNRHLTRFHSTSSGNIGLALQQWINSAVKINDNTILLKKPQLHELPPIYDENWKNLIYQLFIHSKLSNEEMERIYGVAEKKKLDDILRAMLNTHIVEQNEKGEYQLNKTIKPYLENWLNEIGFVK